MDISVHVCIGVRQSDKVLCPIALGKMKDMGINTMQDLKVFVGNFSK
jgi:hypothetical protein